MKLSIIVPVLNEAAGIVNTLAGLAPMRARGVEVVVADGGSTDETMELARPLADVLVTAPRGRGAQMNAGAAASTGTVLLFLHADTRLPSHADFLIGDALARTRSTWGWFDVVIEGHHRLFPVIAEAMNMRARITGVATGDQAIFATVPTFGAGFPDIPLMEDIVISKRLKRIGKPVCIATPAVTSARRWEKHGVKRTILLMWFLRFAFFLGVNPRWLARRYGYVPRQP